MKKKVVCDSSFFLSKNHTTLPMTMYLVFEKTPFFLSQVRFHEAIARDERFIVFCIMYRVTWLFPDQYSYFVCCGLRAIYYKCTHDGDMLCITGTTH